MLCGRALFVYLNCTLYSCVIVPIMLRCVQCLTNHTSVCRRPAKVDAHIDAVALCSNDCARQYFSAAMLSLSTKDDNVVVDRMGVDRNAVTPPPPSSGDGDTIEVSVDDPVLEAFHIHPELLERPLDEYRSKKDRQRYVLSRPLIDLLRKQLSEHQKQRHVASQMIGVIHGEGDDDDDRRGQKRATKEEDDDGDESKLARRQPSALGERDVIAQSPFFMLNMDVLALILENLDLDDLNALMRVSKLIGNVTTTIMTGGNLLGRWAREKRVYDVTGLLMNSFAIEWDTIQNSTTPHECSSAVLFYKKRLTI
jgi:hypothetical protein